MSLVLSERKVLFIHIPKTGGISIQSVWKVYDDKILTSKLDGHMMAREIRSILPSEFEEYTTIAVVRNPWDLHVSWYHYLKYERAGAPIETNIVSELSFKDYTKYIKDTWHDLSQYRLMRRTLCEWCEDEHGEMLVDLVLRFETLSDDFNRTSRQFNLLPIKDLPHRNSTDHAAWRTYYDTESAAIIESLHRPDIDRFGYSF